MSNPNESGTPGDADLLYSLAKIAAFLGITSRQAEYLATRGAFPSFRLGRTICARRSTLRSWLAQTERAAASSRPGS